MENMKSQIDYFAGRLAKFDEEELAAEDDRLFIEAMNVLGATPKIALIEAILSKYKEIRNNIVRNDLPLALSEAGLRSASVEGGIDVSLQTIYESKQIDKEKVATWLDAHGYGDIIKDTLLLPKGAYTLDLEMFLIDNSIDFKRDSTINGNQLKSVVKKHLESGGEMPPKDAMEIKSFTQAVIKKEKVSL